MTVSIINVHGPLLRSDADATMTIVFSSGETVHISAAKVQANSSIITAMDTATNKEIFIDASHIAAITVD